MQTKNFKLKKIFVVFFITLFCLLIPFCSFPSTSNDYVNTLHNKYLSKNPGLGDEEDDKSYAQISSLTSNIYSSNHYKEVIKNSDKSFYARRIYSNGDSSAGFYNAGQILKMQGAYKKIVDGQEATYQNSFTQMGYSLGTTLTHFTSFSKDYQNASESISLSFPYAIIRSSSPYNKIPNGFYQAGFNLHPYIPPNGLLESNDFEYFYKNPNGLALFTHSMSTYINISEKNTEFNGGTSLYSQFNDNLLGNGYFRYYLIHGPDDIFYFYIFSTKNNFPTDTKKYTYIEEQPMCLYSEFTKSELLDSTSGALTPLGNLIVSDFTNSLFSYNSTQPYVDDYTDLLLSSLTNRPNIASHDFYLFVPGSKYFPYSTPMHFENKVSNLSSSFGDGTIINNPGKRSMLIYNPTDTLPISGSVALYLSSLFIANFGTVNGNSLSSTRSSKYYDLVSNYSKDKGGASASDGDDPTPPSSDVESPYTEMQVFPLLISISSGYYYGENDNHVPIGGSDNVFSNTSLEFPLLNPNISVSLFGKPYSYDYSKSINYASIIISVIIIIIIFVSVLIIWPLIYLYWKYIYNKTAKAHIKKTIKNH